MKKPLIAALIAAQLIAVASPALAVEENNVSNGLTAAGAPLGLHGVGDHVRPGGLRQRLRRLPFLRQCQGKDPRCEEEEGKHR